MPNLSHTALQSAVSGTSGSLFTDLPEKTRDLALDVIVNSLRKVFVDLPSIMIFLAATIELADLLIFCLLLNRFILVYVGAAVCLVSSVFMTVSHDSFTKVEATLANRGDRERTSARLWRELPKPEKSFVIFLNL